MTDTERLDWLEAQGNGERWVARRSTMGRGYRLHNTKHHDEQGRPTVREAIDAAMGEDSPGPYGKSGDAKWSGPYGK